MTKNHAASVRARLLNLARAEGDDFQRVLTRYAVERLLYRLSISSHHDKLVLKGATLFALWLGKPHRATRDLDLLGRGDPDVDAFVFAFREIAAIPCPEDGLIFDQASLTGSLIREEAAYMGVRVKLDADLDGAVIALQVDVGTSDAVVPPPQQVDMPSLLELPHARVMAYAKETVIAEKFEAMVQLGIANSRMKDFYDLDLMRRRFSFDGSVVAEAIVATFRRRQTPIPTEIPLALTDTFARDSGKLQQWKAFLRKSGVTDAPELAEVVAGLRAWLWPLIDQGG